jgi:hypothetical protein
MDVGDLSMMLAGEWDEEDFGRSDLDVRGLMGESIFLLLPFVRGRLALSMSMVFLALCHQYAEHLIDQSWYLCLEFVF